MTSVVAHIVVVFVTFCVVGSAAGRVTLADYEAIGHKYMEGIMASPSFTQMGSAHVRLVKSVDAGSERSCPHPNSAVQLTTLMLARGTDPVAGNKPTGSIVRLNDPNNRFKELYEVVAMMCVGDTWDIVLPPNLAFGEEGLTIAESEKDIVLIPPHTPILFRVALVSVVDNGPIHTTASMEKTALRVSSSVDVVPPPRPMWDDAGASFEA